MVDRVPSKAVKAALRVLCRLCLWGQIHVKVVEADVVVVLVKLLLNEAGWRVTELAMVVIDHLCGCGVATVGAGGTPNRAGRRVQEGKIELGENLYMLVQIYQIPNLSLQNGISLPCHYISQT